ncbi:hypothetical protein BGW80DRAFT_657070 [Lactifluus volemus]|nr:hypothetical protein BGW80DRAFT_657070 [Lactifluus volemus]
MRGHDWGQQSYLAQRATVCVRFLGPGLIIWDLFSSLARLRHLAFHFVPGQRRRSSYKGVGNLHLIGFTKQLQTAENEAIRITSGAWSHYTKLYRLPRKSQLLKRLGEGWSSHLPADLSLPSSPLRNCPTCSRLTAMAQLIPTHGPRLRTRAAPRNLSNWGDRLT